MKKKFLYQILEILIYIFILFFVLIFIIKWVHKRYNKIEKKNLFNDATKTKPNIEFTRTTMNKKKPAKLVKLISVDISAKPHEFSADNTTYDYNNMTPAIDYMLFDQII